jgi:hypothetical protein
VAAGEQVAVPLQDRVGSDRRPQPPECRPGQRVQQRGQPHPIGRCEPDLPPVELTLHHAELVAQRQESRRGESHPPPLAEPCVSLSAYTAPIARPTGVRPKRQWANSRGDRREASAISSRARCGRRRSRLYLRVAQRTR